MPHPDLETIRAVRDCAEEHADWTVNRIAKQLGVSRGSVQKYITNSRYDTYVDEIAVMRALEGEREVFDNLTVFEMAEFRRRLTAFNYEQLQTLAEFLEVNLSSLTQERFRQNLHVAA